MGFGDVQAVVRDYSQVRLLEGTIIRKIDYQGEKSREHSHFLITKSATSPALTHYSLLPPSATRKCLPIFQRPALLLASGSSPSQAPCSFHYSLYYISASHFLLDHSHLHTQGPSVSPNIYISFDPPSASSPHPSFYLLHSQNFLKRYLHRLSLPPCLFSLVCS